MSTKITLNGMIWVPNVHKHPSYRFSPVSPGLSGCELLYLQHSLCGAPPPCWSKMASSSCRIEIRNVTSCPVFDVSLIYILITFFLLIQIVILLSNKYSLNNCSQQTMLSMEYSIVKKISTAPLSSWAGGLGLGPLHD